MRRYLSMIVLASALAVVLPVVMAPWLIVGPWRILKKFRSVQR